MRTGGILRWFIFWRGSGFLRYRNAKIIMLGLTLDSSGCQRRTVVMKKVAYKSTSVQTLWYMWISFLLYFYFFFTTCIIYRFVTQNIKVYSHLPLLTFNNSVYFFQTNATSVESRTKQCELSLSWQKMHHFLMKLEILTQHWLGGSE